jgi:formate hydrogenlyase subunit 6/NADH:ubiquinone oxidoreductase subunit I
LCVQACPEKAIKLQKRCELENTAN